MLSASQTNEVSIAVLLLLLERGYGALLPAASCTSGSRSRWRSHRGGTAIHEAAIAICPQAAPV
jgi:hypothetical protein